MKYSKMALIGIIVVLLCLLCPLANVSAEPVVKEIHEDHYHVAKIISFYEGEYINVYYDVEVIDGPGIDVFLLNSENYINYQEGKAIMTQLGATYLNIGHIRDSVRLYEHGKYYLILDNTDFATKPPWNMIDDVATVIYNVTTITYSPWTEVDDGNDIPSFEFAFLIIAIASVIILKRRKQ